ncbi:MAG: hypothetical protein CM1200mP35_06140 [Chloroflexota bacterium]|nr:MAG: hypothetical protein CM1200mP35_06140 [Chloroflexota bacterium]
MTKRGVPVTSVNHLPTYGVLSSNPGITSEEDRFQMLNSFSRMYSPTIGTGPTMEYLAQAGQDALKGADIIRVAPQSYSSSFEYANNNISRRLRDVAQVHLAGLGTQVFYTAHGSFDTHYDQMGSHAKLWMELSTAVNDFFADLEEHDASDEVVIRVFSEFGRRFAIMELGQIRCCRCSFCIGDQVNGGMYGSYPSLNPEHLTQGDLEPNYDFRGLYSSLIERWLRIDPVPIVGGTFEQMAFV